MASDRPMRGTSEVSHLYLEIGGRDSWLKASRFYQLNLPAIVAVSYVVGFWIADIIKDGIVERMIACYQ